METMWKATADVGAASSEAATWDTSTDTTHVIWEESPVWDQLSGGGGTTTDLQCRSLQLYRLAHRLSSSSQSPSNASRHAAGKDPPRGGKSSSRFTVEPITERGESEQQQQPCSISLTIVTKCIDAQPSVRRALRDMGVTLLEVFEQDTSTEVITCLMDIALAIASTTTNTNTQEANHAENAPRRNIPQQQQQQQHQQQQRRSSKFRLIVCSNSRALCRPLSIVQSCALFRQVIVLSADPAALHVFSACGLCTIDWREVTTTSALVLKQQRQQQLQRKNLPHPHPHHPQQQQHEATAAAADLQSQRPRLPELATASCIYSDTASLEERVGERPGYTRLPALSFSSSAAVAAGTTSSSSGTRLSTMTAGSPKVMLEPLRKGLESPAMMAHQQYQEQEHQQQPPQKQRLQRSLLLQGQLQRQHHTPSHASELRSMSLSMRRGVSQPLPNLHIAQARTGKATPAQLQQLLLLQPRQRGSSIVPLHPTTAAENSTAPKSAGVPYPYDRNRAHLMEKSKSLFEDIIRYCMKEKMCPRESVFRRRAEEHLNVKSARRSKKKTRQLSSAYTVSSEGANQVSINGGKKKGTSSITGAAASADTVTPSTGKVVTPEGASHRRRSSSSSVRYVPLYFDDWIKVLLQLHVVDIEGSSPHRIFWPAAGKFECADFHRPRSRFPLSSITELLEWLQAGKFEVERGRYGFASFLSERAPLAVRKQPYGYLLELVQLLLNKHVLKFEEGAISYAPVAGVSIRELAASVALGGGTAAGVNVGGTGEKALILRSPGGSIQLPGSTGGATVTACVKLESLCFRAYHTVRSHFKSCRGVAFDGFRVGSSVCHQSTEEAALGGTTSAPSAAISLPVGDEYPSFWRYCAPLFHYERTSPTNLFVCVVTVPLTLVLLHFVHGEHVQKKEEVEKAVSNGGLGEHKTASLAAAAAGVTALPKRKASRISPGVDIRRSRYSFLKRFKSTPKETPLAALSEACARALDSPYWSIVLGGGDLASEEARAVFQRQLVTFNCVPEDLLSVFDFHLQAFGQGRALYDTTGDVIASGAETEWRCELLLNISPNALPPGGAPWCQLAAPSPEDVVGGAACADDYVDDVESNVPIWRVRCAELEESAARALMMGVDPAAPVLRIRTRKKRKGEAKLCVANSALGMISAARKRYHSYFVPQGPQLPVMDQANSEMAALTETEVLGSELALSMCMSVLGDF